MADYNDRFEHVTVFSANAVFNGMTDKEKEEVAGRKYDSSDMYSRPLNRLCCEWAAKRKKPVRGPLGI